MTWFSSGSPRVGVVLTFVLFLVQAPVLSAQEITPSDVEQHLRAWIAAWNSGDLVRAVEFDAPGDSPGVGFGYRTRATRVRSKEDHVAAIRAFLKSMEYFRITEDEIFTAVDGDIGLAWGFFTEEFRVRGRTPEKVRVRFTAVLKKESSGWRQLLFHRDAQPFDDKGNYIPALAALKE